jgi:hypothetical protein
MMHRTQYLLCLLHVEAAHLRDSRSVLVNLIVADLIVTNNALSRLIQDSKLPARVAPSERDEQLVELSRILNDCYASSGYFLAAVANGQSNFDVDRWSDRFRLQDASRRKQLFDEGSLSLRDFPPELGEMADRHTKRRRRLGSWILRVVCFGMSIFVHNYFFSSRSAAKICSKYQYAHGLCYWRRCFWWCQRRRYLLCSAISIFMQNRTLIFIFFQRKLWNNECAN